MAYRTMELTLISAKDLKDVNLFSKMEVYAVVSIDGDARSRQRTTADHAGGSNPSWNSTLRFSLPPDDPARHVLHVLLRSERALGDRDVGEVHIPLKELLDGAVTGKGAPQFVSYQVRSPSSGKAKGILNLSYKIADAPAASAAAPWADVPVTAYPTGPGTAAAAYPKADEPFTAYPAPGSGNGAYPPPAKAGKAEVPSSAYPASGTGAAYPPPAKASKSDEPVTAYPARSSTGTSYPPPQGVAAPYPHPTGYPAYPQQYGYAGAPPPAGYGYPPPPPAGYGYPPAGYGYGAAQPAMAQPQKKKNKFGMGLGAGLLGGALGGLLIGDLVSDAGDYDAGYDAGFDDGGGFDF